LSGKPLSGELREATTDAMRLWLLSTADLDEGASVGDRFLKWICHLREPIDVYELCKSLKDRRDEWRRVEEQPIRLTSLLYPVLPCIAQYCVSGDVWCYKIVHHYLSFLSKLPIPRPELSDEAIEKFIRKEEEIRAIDWHDPHRLAAVAEIRVIIQDWMRDYSYTHFPEHGPGSTADAGPSLQEKMKKCVPDDLFEMVPEWYSFTTPYEDGVTDYRYKIKRVSKMVLVPKTALSLRTICEEEAVLQYFQKAMQKDFDEVFRRTQRRYHVDLHDQSFSQLLCIHASATGRWSTLDLSSASDSVSNFLVEHTFPLHVLRGLMAVRSREVLLPTGEQLTLSKYAPMGSSVTFPLECIIFTACCEAVVRRYAYTEQRRSGVPYCVYGDDIIIRNEYVAELVELLEVLGFEVNRDKSFDHNSFRESCGVFAIHGKDITTPMIPRDHTRFSAPFSPAQAARLISLCNQFLVAGMPMARAYVLSHIDFRRYGIPFRQFSLSFLRKLKGDREQFSEGGLWSFLPVENNHLKMSDKIPDWPTTPRSCSFPLTCNGRLLLPCKARRRSARPYYGRKEYVQWYVSTERYKIPYNDSTRYREWLRSAAEHPGHLDPVQVSVGFGPRTRLRKRAKSL
jgi:hypothetical protein